MDVSNLHFQACHQLTFHLELQKREDAREGHEEVQEGGVFDSPKIIDSPYFGLLNKDLMNVLASHLDLAGKRTFRLLNSKIKFLMETYHLVMIPEITRKNQVVLLMKRSTDLDVFQWESSFKEFKDQVLNRLDSRL